MQKLISYNYSQTQISVKKVLDWYLCKTNGWDLNL